MSRHRLHVAASRLHRWLALFAGIQIILWFASGLVMSLLPIERVRGEHLVDRAAAPLPAGVTLAPLATPVVRASLTMRAGRPVLEAEGTDGTVRLLDPATGQAAPPLDAAGALAIARAAWRGGETAPIVRPATAADGEFRQKLPAWRVDMGDADATRVYVGDSGRILAVRTRTWRAYDFMWGLHIMDWTERERFNTPWLAAFAGAALLLAIAGLTLLRYRLRPWRWRRNSRRETPVPAEPNR